MATLSQASAILSPLASSEEYTLDPHKSLPDYRREIYDLLQYLDEEQDKIDKDLARFSSSSSSSSSRKPMTRRQQQLDEDGACSESEDDEDDFVVVEDVNAATRKKQLLNQLQQLWRTRDALRKRAKQLNIRIDSLSHGKGSGLMSMADVDFDGQDDSDEL